MLCPGDAGPLLPTASTSNSWQQQWIKSLHVSLASNQTPATVGGSSQGDRQPGPFSTRKPATGAGRPDAHAGDTGQQASAGKSRTWAAVACIISEDTRQVLLLTCLALCSLSGSCEPLTDSLVDSSKYDMYVCSLPDVLLTPLVVALQMDDDVPLTPLPLMPRVGGGPVIRLCL